MRPKQQTRAASGSRPRITRIGHRLTGDRRDTVDGSSWEYVRIAIGDATRVGYLQILRDEQGDHAVAFLRGAVAYYAALGVVIREVLTDNGSCFRRRGLAAACQELGIVRRPTRPHTPRANCKAERFIKTAMREWAFVRAYHHSGQRIAELPRWLHRYNLQLPHSPLNSLTPAARLGLSRNDLLNLHS